MFRVEVEGQKIFQELLGTGNTLGAVDLGTGKEGQSEIFVCKSPRLGDLGEIHMF